MYLSRYDKPKNGTSFWTKVKRPKQIPLIAWRKAPQLYSNLGPIWVPYAPKIGAKIKAARLVMPKTNPYWLGEAPLSSASFG